jgi:CIC family chloride channel protein
VNATHDDADDIGRVRDLLVLLGVGIIAAVMTGFVGGSFRWFLIRVDRARVDLVDAVRDVPAVGWLVPVAIAAGGAAVARAMVRRVPLAGGSGIQDVEAVWRGEAEPPPLAVVPVRFVGGLIAIGSGLVLGREGPTVHMGATLGAETGRRAKLRIEDVRLLQTALGGAGLAVAFNAPLAGALFALEEVARSFRLRLVLVTLVGCAVATACSRLVLGDAPDFRVASLPIPPAGQLVVFAAFGLATGVLGVVYARLVIGALAVVDRSTRLPVETRAAVIGAVVGLGVWFVPPAVGGGNVISQDVLDGRLVWASALGYLAIRFVVGPLSYAAGTPGGIFAPILAVGALWGVVVHAGVHAVWSGVGSSVAPLAIVGMVAFFAAVVRAPLTGIVLISEMTATTSLFVPMLAATVGAVLVATATGTGPIYTSLRVRMLAQRGGEPPD